MALYTYVHKRHKKNKTVAIVISIVLLTSGLGLLIWSLLPILMFELYYGPQFGNILTPLPDTSVSSISERLPKILGFNIIDYTQASVWFPKATGIPPVASESQGTESYSLSIPKLGIDNANVVVGGDDLTKSLVHFVGPLPGANGNPVIFGHSTLPFLYDPKNYKTIFTKLPNLKKGDEILVRSDSIQYRYIVSDMKITSPDDLSVLNQTYDGSYLTLITCVPPGTTFNRFIVKTKLDTL